MNENYEFNEIEEEVLEIEVFNLDDGKQLVYEGDYEDFLEQNNYDSELEFILNKLLTNDQKSGIFVNEDGERLYIKKVI